MWTKQIFIKLPVAFLCIALSACTTVPKDGGVADVDALLGDRLSDDITLPAIHNGSDNKSESGELQLPTPLSLADAEKLAIESNATVRAELLNVGIAASDYAQAGRMENPGVSFERFNSVTYSRSILFDVGGLLLMPLKRQLTQRRLDQAKYQSAAAIMAHLAETRRAWFMAVAEQQKSIAMKTALESAEVNNELTRQMAAIGHSGVIEAAQSEMLLGDMRAAITRQELAELRAREVLIQQLGLWGKSARQLTLPSVLPTLPDRPLDVTSVEGVAVKSRLDVVMARLNYEATASNLNLTRKNPFLSMIELGPVKEKGEDEVERGFELEFRLPIFDPGDITTKKARFVFAQARAQAESVVVQAASEARQALATYHGTWDIAHNYSKNMLPVRERVNREQLLQYNGMLISVFDLLRDVRDTTAMHVEAIDATKEFWIADTNLQAAMTGTGGGVMNFDGASALPVSGGADGGH